MFTHCRPASRSGCSQFRSGVAATELALCLPLIVMLVLGSIEACSMIFLNHSLSIASYEGVRVAINFDATTQEVEDRCESLIDARNVSGGLVSISPSNVATVPRGQQIAVTVSAPCDANALIPPWFFGGKTLSATTIMVKE
jgi:Flp pilus assembly protein TadG